MNCPTCKETQLVISERKGIEIDYCPACRGVWLDRGELDKIIEKSNIEAEPSRQRVTESSYSPYKKKKSFFEDLFD